MEKVKVDEKVRVDVPPSMQHTVTIIEASPRVDAMAMIWASVIAGLASLAIEMILVAATYGVRFWAPLRVIASVILGPNVLSPTGAFTIPIAFVGIVVQLVASIIYGFIGIEVLRPRHWLTAVFGTGVWGFLTYIINFFLWPLLVPWLVMFRDWTWIASSIAFGVILGLLYLALRKPRIRMVEV